jgi:hypothetical protein
MDTIDVEAAELGQSEMTRSHQEVGVWKNWKDASPQASGCMCRVHCTVGHEAMRPEAELAFSMSRRASLYT